jgi:tetratricopeptide (TPR) repeat protein
MYLLLMLHLAAATLWGASPDVQFDAANKLYEQGRYAEAAAAYEQLARLDPNSETIQFNLGNAWFKAGQTGRAIAAWRQVERSTPRDPGVRFNLQFARKKVSGTDSPQGSAWQRALAALTLNEWSVLASTTVWLWFLLLGLREVRPNLRLALRGYTATAGIVAFLLAGCVAGAYAQSRTPVVVVVVAEAIARSGPLDEAKVLHQFRDGTELTIVDKKQLNGPDQTQSWILGRDPAQRQGWIKRDQVIFVEQKAP